MIKKLLLLFTGLATCVQLQEVKAQIPFSESFTRTTAQDATLQFGGSPSAFLTAGVLPGDTDGNGYLRLTSSQQYQKGYVYSTRPIPTSDGITVQFEYYTYGGSRADGITFFLFDSSLGPFNIGSFGGSLGYAPITLGSTNTPGVSNGYIGIGIDEYGNFSNPTEGRSGKDASSTSTTVPGFFPESITIRGKGNGLASVPNNYPFLATKNVTAMGIALTGGSTRHPDPNDPDYRKVFMYMKPRPGGGFFITVKLLIGGVNGGLRTIIDTFEYTTPAPAVLNYGIASSTGDQTNFHEIRNVTITKFDNAPPVAVNDAKSTSRGTPVQIDIVANDTDDGGNANIPRNSIVIKTPPTHGTLSINTTTGIVTYTPDPNYVGSDVFTYTIKDLEGIESQPATVSLTISPTAQPNAPDDNATTFTNEPVLINVTANDDGGNSPIDYSSVTIVTPPAHGSVTVNPTTGVVTYTPTTNYDGKDSFQYTIRNTNGLVSTPVTNVNISVRPKGSDDSAQTPINTPVPIAVKNNDVSKNGTSVVQVTPPTRGSVAIDPSGIVTYTPQTGFTGFDTFTYKLVDADFLESAPITVTIAVGNRPTAVDDNATTVSTTPVTINLPLNDQKGDAELDKSSIIKTNPLHGTVTIDPATGIATYTPTGVYHGKDSFTYTIKGVDGLTSNVANVNINVRPRGTNDNYSTLLNTPRTLAVKSNDESAVNTTVVKLTNPTKGTAVVNPDGTILYTPNLNATGADQFTYKLVNTDNLDSDPITVFIGIGSPPVAVNDASTTIVNVPVVIDVPANDTDPAGSVDRTSVVITSQPAHGTVAVDPFTGRVTFTPVTDYHGKDVFTYTIRSANSQIVSNTATVTVNIRPVGSNDVAATAMNVPVVIAVKDNDLSKLNTTVVPLSGAGNVPANGTIAINPAGTITYTPNANFFGTDTFKYLLRNTDGLDSDPITVTVTINRPPTANTDVATTRLDTPIQIDVPANDTDTDGSIDRTTVTIVTPPLHGTVSVDPLTGKVTYTPSPGYVGPDTFIYTVKDNKGLVSNPASVNINVKRNPKIGVAKSLVSSTQAINGSYDITYLFTVANYGDEVLNAVNIRDDLAATFGTSKVLVNSITALGTLKVNTAYNGISVVDLLASGNTLAVGATQQLRITINVMPARSGTFNNTSFAEGTDPDNVKATDQSANGLKPDPGTPGDVTPAEITPVTLTLNGLFIPGGFSPNGDGINDEFVIRNTYGRNIQMEVYNRWGNLIYRSRDYQNNWSGKTTEGLHIGDDAPEGTYYYIIIIDNKDKYVGHLTLNR